MRLTVTDEGAAPRENTGIGEYRFYIPRNGGYDPRVEVDEVRVASRGAVIKFLRDTVRIVTGRTRSAFLKM